MKIGSQITNPGEMRTKIAFYSRGVTTSAGGFQTPSQTLIAEAMAKWTNAHGQEALLADSVQAQNAATVLVRWRSGLDATCLVEKGGQYFEIISLDDIQERHEYIELKVKRWQPG